MPNRILVVEDRADTRRGFAKVLRDGGYDVTEAENGAAALGAARQQAPRLVLMDLSMPVMDGWTAAAYLRQEPRGHDLLIVALTTQVLLQQQMGLVTRLFDDVIVKPVAPNDLLRRIGTLLSAVERDGDSEEPDPRAAAAAGQDFSKLPADRWLR